MGKRPSTLYSRKHHRTWASDGYDVSGSTSNLTVVPVSSCGTGAADSINRPPFRIPLGAVAFGLSSLHVAQAILSAVPDRPRFKIKGLNPFDREVEIIVLAQDEVAATQAAEELGIRQATVHLVKPKAYAVGDGQPPLMGSA